MIQMSRAWAMPTADTFDCPPIGEFVRKYLRESRVSIDPFARNKRWATYTNDLNPATAAEYHMEASEFCDMLQSRSVKVDLAIFDPPYSPRQISECYAGIGRKATMKDTQNAVLYKTCRDALAPLVLHGGFALSFGWNSGGFSSARGFEVVEVMLVCHGAARNDTICVAERLIAEQGRLAL